MSQRGVGLAVTERRVQSGVWTAQKTNHTQEPAEDWHRVGKLGSGDSEGVALVMLELDWYDVTGLDWPHTPPPPQPGPDRVGPTPDVAVDRLIPISHVSSFFSFFFLKKFFSI